MRKTNLLRMNLVGLLAAGALSSLPNVISAQEPSPFLAVNQCLIKPGEGQALQAAFAEYVEYALENMPETPGNVYGAFRQRVWGPAHFTTVFEVANVAEYDNMARARRRARADDARLQELWQAWNSHLVPQSCQVSFHQRWPTG